MRSSARTAAARLATALGEPVPLELMLGSEDTVSRLFPAPAAIAEHAAEVLTGPRRRIETVRAAAAALAAGDLVVDPGRDPEELRVELEAIPGIGPWTAGYVALRVLGATDVLLDTDLAIRHGAAALGLASDVGDLWRAAATRPRRTERTA